MLMTDNGNEVVTKAHLRAELAETQLELKTDISKLRVELSELRVDFTTKTSELRVDMTEGFAALGVGLANLRSEMHAGFRRQQSWAIATLVSLVLALAAVVGTIFAIIRSH